MILHVSHITLTPQKNSRIPVLQILRNKSYVFIKNIEKKRPISGFAILHHAVLEDEEIYQFAVPELKHNTS